LWLLVALAAAVLLEAVAVLAGLELEQHLA
jgi:hypothetical protein